MLSHRPLRWRPAGTLSPVPEVSWAEPPGPGLSWAELLREITSGGLPPVAESPRELERATVEVLGWVYIDPLVRRTLRPRAASERMAQLVDQIGNAVIARYQATDAAPGAAPVQTPAPPPFPPQPQADVLAEPSAEPDQAPSLESQLVQAEASLRRRLPEISAKLSQVEQAADQATANPELRNVVEQVARVVRRLAGSGLSPVALLVILWWLFVVAFPSGATNEIAVLALWYAVARDSWKKGD